MNTAITGASGQMGRLVVSRLKPRLPPVQLIALARTPTKAADLGVTTREADYNKPDTVARALADIQTLLLISSSELGQRAAHHRTVIEAAQKTGVKRIVYTSLLHADTSPLSLAPEHRETEAMLQESGIEHTILRNGWYTENYTAAIPGALAAGAFIGCSGDGRISSATRADFADAAVVVLTSAGHEGRTYELAGDESYTLADLAAEISRQTGKTIPYKNLSAADYAAALAKVGLPAPIAAAIAGWGVEAAKGALFDDSKQLSKLIGRPTTPLSETVKAALGK